MKNTLVTLAILALVVGCSRGDLPKEVTAVKPEKTAAVKKPAPAPAAKPAAPAAKPATPAAPAGPAILATVGGEAATVYRTRCATCHGLSGKGDGAASKAFPVKPRSFADPAWQKSVTDDHIRTVIVKGGAAVGKSPLMAPNADLAAKKDVLDGLVKIVRGIK